MTSRVVPPAMLDLELRRQHDLARSRRRAMHARPAGRRSITRSEFVRRVRLGGALVAMLTVFAFASVASASHVAPVLVAGNPSCADLGFDFEVKFDPPPATGVTETKAAGNPPGFITVTTTSDGVFTWTSNLEVLAVIVKGGPNANVYYYNPPTTFTDSGLHAPQGYSHISFCFDNPNVPQGEPLDVSKTAAGTSNLRYTWTIDKAVDQTSQTGTPPGTVTFNYTVTVNHDAGVESGFTVSGVITVTNANAYAVTGVTITDELDDGTVCAVTGGTNATIPASGSANFNYTCSPADDTATENTVTVDWPDQAGPPFLPAGTADFTAAVSWTQTVVDECITVTDTHAGTLGTACVGETMPKAFNYSRDVTIPEFGCVNVDNTATFTTNDTGATGSDSVTVTVCSSFDGCTPGFWKQMQHFDSWVGYSPSQTLESVFDVPDSLGLDSNTLLEALSFTGGNNTKGAAQILLRAGVAALLNAANPDVDYPMTTAEVIADVNAALASGSRATMLSVAAELDEANNAGCELS